MRRIGMQYNTITRWARVTVNGEPTGAYFEPDDVQAGNLWGSCTRAGLDYEELGKVCAACAKLPHVADCKTAMAELTLDYIEA